MFQAINLWPQWSMWHFCDSVNWEIRGFRNISGIFEIFVTSNLVVNKILPVSLFNEAEIMISHFLLHQPRKVLANIPLTHSPNFIPLTHNSVPQLIFLVASLHIPHESPCHRQPSSSSLTICLFTFSSSLLWDLSLCHHWSSMVPTVTRTPDHWPLVTGWASLVLDWCLRSTWTPVVSLCVLCFTATQRNAILDTPCILSEILKSWIQHKSKR